jgi:hypothetical protein
MYLELRYAMPRNPNYQKPKLTYSTTEKYIDTAMNIKLNLVAVLLSNKNEFL